MPVLLLNANIEPRVAIEPDLHVDRVSHVPSGHCLRQALQRDGPTKTAGVEDGFLDADVGNRGFSRDRFGLKRDPPVSA